MLAAAVAVSAFNAMQVSFDREVLPPASVPPVSAVCTQPLDISAGDDVSPLFCTDGSINTMAWSLVWDGRDRVMTLGRGAGPADVRAAISRDLQTSMSGRRECSAAVLSAAYYGWNFHIDPVSGLPLDCSILR